ncbi:hypothetical protein [Actinomadura darangshiensis]|nr:hypothetical protein [Actinomadura darangshiensis]
MSTAKVRAALSAALMGATMGVVGLSGAGTAAAAAPCWYSGGHWWCNNVSGAAVYDYNRDTARAYPDPAHIAGRMYSNPSWFDCRIENVSTGGGGPHPNRWIWTKADNGAWGWMKDSAIYSETNSLPACW